MRSVCSSAKACPRIRLSLPRVSGPSRTLSGYSRFSHVPDASQRSNKSAGIIVAAARTGKRRDFEERLRDVGFIEDDG